MQMKVNSILLAIAAVALVITGYQEINAKPQAHEVSENGCTAQAIKDIDNITERAIQSSKCAQRGK